MYQTVQFFRKGRKRNLKSLLKKWDLKDLLRIGFEIPSPPVNGFDILFISNVAQDLGCSKSS